jgi:hypothetical protein
MSTYSLNDIGHGYNATPGCSQNVVSIDAFDVVNLSGELTIGSTSISSNSLLTINGTTTSRIFTSINSTSSTEQLVISHNGDKVEINNANTSTSSEINFLARVNFTSPDTKCVTASLNDNTTRLANTEFVQNELDNLRIRELFDITITSATSGNFLYYNGTIWENLAANLTHLNDVNVTGVTTGDILIYDGTNFINFAPTYLDGAGISDHYLIKVVGGATTQTSITETNTTNSTNITFNNGSIETEIFNTTKKRMHLTTDGIASTNGITITSDGRVGIGVVEPDEVLQIDGTLRIEDDRIQTLTFYDTHGGSTKEHARIEVDDDGGGADILFYTRPSGGTPPTEKLRINKNGAIGIGGATYGTTNQVLVSNGSGSSVSWENPTTNFDEATIDEATIDTLACDTANFSGNFGVNGTLTIGGNYGTAGDVIISNGSGSSVSWRTPVILGASLTNSSYTGANPRSVVIYDNVEFETVSCYNTSTGVFTAPRTAYYMVNAYARVTDFIAPFGARPLSYIYKKVGGTFTLYSVADFVDENENLKVATPRTNIIINLNSGEEIRHEVTFPSNSSFTYAIRGDAFEIRCSYLSIHSIN